MFVYTNVESSAGCDLVSWVRPSVHVCAIQWSLPWLFGICIHQYFCPHGRCRYYLSVGVFSFGKVFPAFFLWINLSPFLMNCVRLSFSFFPKCFRLLCFRTEPTFWHAHISAFCCSAACGELCKDTKDKSFEMRWRWWKIWNEPTLVLVKMIIEKWLLFSQIKCGFSTQ